MTEMVRQRHPGEKRVRAARLEVGGRKGERGTSTYIGLILVTLVMSLV